jgi:succinate dehydrogenase/fumarate reductase-like Fe-S protein
MEVNGSRRPTCMTGLSAFAENEARTITRLRTFPVIGDLVAAGVDTPRAPGRKANVPLKARAGAGDGRRQKAGAWNESWNDPCLRLRVSG